LDSDTDLDPHTALNKNFLEKILAQKLENRRKPNFFAKLFSCHTGSRTDMKKIEALF
jgi:hypothetical protein